MAIAVLPVSEPARKQPRPGRRRFEAHGLFEEESRIRAIVEIASYVNYLAKDEVGTKEEEEKDDREKTREIVSID